MHLQISWDGVEGAVTYEVIVGNERGIVFSVRKCFQSVLFHPN